MQDFLLTLILTVVLAVAIEAFLLFFCFKKLKSGQDSTLDLSDLSKKQEGTPNEREVLMTQTNAETGEWINKVLERTLLGAQGSQNSQARVVDNLNSEFNEIMRKTRIVERLVVKSFDFGTRAPEIRSIHVEKSSSLSMADLGIIASIHYIGQISLGIDLTLNLPPFGNVNLSVKVTIEEVSAKMRFRFFVDENQAPSYSVSLLEEPPLTIGVEFLIGDKEKYKNMAEQAILKILKFVIKARMVEPNSKIFPLLSSEKEEIVQKAKNAKKSIGRLVVTPIGAQDVAAADRNGLSDPYCVVRFGKEEKKTKIHPKTLNPQWRQTFTFDVYDQTSDLILEVFDHDILSKDDFLGQVVVPFSTITDKEVPRKEILLPNPRFDEKDGVKVRGSLLFSVFFNSLSSPSCLPASSTVPSPSFSEKEGFLPPISERKFSSSRSFDFGDRQSKVQSEKSKLSQTSVMLGVEVREAKGLLGSGKSGLSDPYCVINVGKKSKKTKTIEKTLNPKWNQKFVFLLEAPTQEITFSLYDWDFGTRDDFLGMVIIPLQSLGMNSSVVKTCSLLPRESTGQDKRVKGEITVQLVQEVVPVGEKERWRKFFLGEHFESARERSTLDSEDAELLHLEEEDAFLEAEGEERREKRSEERKNEERKEEAEERRPSQGGAAISEQQGGEEEAQGRLSSDAASPPDPIDSSPRLGRKLSHFFSRRSQLIEKHPSSPLSPPPSSPLPAPTPTLAVPPHPDHLGGEGGHHKISSDTPSIYSTASSHGDSDTHSIHSVQSAHSTFSSASTATNASTSLYHQGPSLLSGTLLKLSGALIKKWRPRIFDLKEKALLFREQKEDPPKVLKISDIVTCETLPEKKYGKKHCFKVTTRNKEYIFQIDKDSDYNSVFHSLSPSSHRD